MKEHNDLILELPNFVPRALCERIIEKFENSPNTQKGTVIYNNVEQVIPELKNSTELCTCCEYSMKDDHREIVKYIKDAEEQYFTRLHDENIYNQPRHMFDAIFTLYPDHDYTPTVQRQPRGGKYAWHFDGGGGGMRQYATMIIYLNTLKPGEGGCTEFYHGRKVRPECGKVLIWPGVWAYPHCGNEVKAHYKYTIVTTLHLNNKNKAS
jgi:hypothetical protein